MKELGYYWLFEEGRFNCDTGETNASSNLARVLIVMEEMMQCKLNALFSNSSNSHVIRQTVQAAVRAGHVLEAGFRKTGDIHIQIIER